VTPPRVLVVDDNHMNIELVEFILNADACTVASAGHADQAIALIDTFKPDLILMDIQMPGVDGLELTRRIKANPDTRHVVIVAFTAFAMMGDEAKMLAAGCDGYLSKPIDVASFAGRVRSFIAANA
jgi:two-component system cell cycle response regulator DivK